MLEIPGEPIGKERPRRGKHGNFYTPRKTQAHEKLIAQLAMVNGNRYEGPVELDVIFYRKNKLLDLDNAVKTVMDGLQKGQMLKTDRQVVSLRAIMIFCTDDQTPKTIVNVFPLEKHVT